MSDFRYCGSSRAGCLLDTFLQLLIFIFLGLYAVKFSELIQNNVEYEYNKTMHYGKLLMELCLMIMSIVSFFVVLFSDHPAYYLVLRYITNILIWIVIFPITFYEHQYIGCTSTWFRIVIFIMVIDTSLQVLFEQIVKQQKPINSLNKQRTSPSPVLSLHTVPYS